MSGIRITDEFKRDAVAQVVDRGYLVAEVSERLGPPSTGRSGPVAVWCCPQCSFRPLSVRTRRGFPAHC